jgi:glutaredoxin-like protein
MKDEQKEQLKERFKELDGSVKLIVFTQEMECQYCKENRELMEDISTISDKIAVEIYDFVSDKKQVEKYMIDKIPATVVEGEKDYGIRFYGIPAGYEFTSLIGTIIAVSKGDSQLSEEVRTALGKLKSPLNIQVFITLTCPYCPTAVEIAHGMSIESDLVTSSMVESSEFPHLAQKFNVTSVPKVVVNDSFEFHGAVPEDEFLENAMKALEPNSQDEKEEE